MAPGARRRRKVAAGAARGSAGDRSGTRARRRSPAAAPPEDLGSMTKAALMARAAELDVAGRSKMHRDELEAAVRRASRRKAS